MASKRKRTSDDVGQTQTSFRVSDLPPDQHGPVLVSFPCVTPAASTPFVQYYRKKPKTDEIGSFIEDAPKILIAGEAETIEFTSSYEETKNACNSGAQYMIALHNPRTLRTTVLPTPLHVLAPKVKALKSLQSSEDSSGLAFYDAKNKLGETFGTKKALKNIRARERNKVDVSAMEGVASYIGDGIDQRTEALPSKEEAMVINDNARPIPAFNLDAKEVESIYPLHNVIPETEWQTLNEKAQMLLSLAPKANESANPGETMRINRERNAMIPFSRSAWLNSNLSKSGLSKREAKILYYISSMLSFRRHCERGVTTSDTSEQHSQGGAITKEALYSKMSGVPTPIVDGLVARFMEGVRGSPVRKATSENQMKLLTHVFALCLRIDNYAVDTSVIATDLSMTADKINNLFRALGCTMKKLTDRELATRGIAASSGNTKRAVLTVPLTFPKPKYKRRT